MAEIKLENSTSVAIIDDTDKEIIDKFRWRAAKGKNTQYAVTRMNGTTVLMHRFILRASGRNKFVDHKNGNGLDNRRDNIRVCTPSENNRNKRIYKNNTSRMKGVTALTNGKFISRIRTGEGLIYLGTFKSLEDAAIAYDNAAKAHHQEFAYLNFG